MLSDYSKIAVAFGANVLLYISGLLGIGYIMWSITGDMWVVLATILVARWLKPMNLLS